MPRNYWLMKCEPSAYTLEDLETLKRTKGLEQMMVNQKGSRLSVQPVTKREFDVVCRLGRR